jgi:hypothetical protein
MLPQMTHVENNAIISAGPLDLLHELSEYMITGGSVRPVEDAAFQFILALSKVTINTAPLQPDAVYEFRVESAGVWYDPFFKMSNIALRVSSDALIQRRQDILAQIGATNDVYPADYAGVIMIAYDVAPYTVSNKPIINGLSDAVARRFAGKSYLATGEKLVSIPIVSE